MNTTLKVTFSEQLFDIRVVAQWLGRVTALSIIAYSVAYSLAIAPKRFAVVSGPSGQSATMTIRQISSLKTKMIPLELPRDEDSLVKSLNVQSDPQLRSAQLRLYRRALDWDNWFVILYPLQLFSVALLIWKDLDPQRSVLARRVVGMSAVLVIAATGILDRLENFHLNRILEMAPTWNVNDLSFFAGIRQAVAFASTCKWAAWGASCLLLFVLSRWIVGNSWLRSLGWVLAISGVLAGLGAVPHWHGLLSLSVILYGLVPLTITYHLILLPLLKMADRKVEELVRQSWQKADVPAELTLAIYAGGSERRRYRTWSAGGAMPMKSPPSATTPTGPAVGNDTSDEKPTSSE